MGQYFAWVNASKKERLEMGVFSGSVKAAEACWVGNDEADAVCTLLQSRWAGDEVAFIGDYCTDYWPDESAEALAYRESTSPVFLDYAEDAYEDVSGLFKEAEGMEYTVFEGDSTIQRPYEGPFELEIKRFRYVVNHSKKLFFDRKSTPVRCVMPHRIGIYDEIVRFDPLPILFAKGTEIAWFSNHTNPQFEIDWVGDDVEVRSDTAPAGYLDVSPFYNYWPPSLLADDEEVLEAMGSDCYKELVASGADEMEALKAILPNRVVASFEEPSYWLAIEAATVGTRKGVEE